MTHRDEGPKPPPQRIESPGIADDKTRPLRTVENVDPDAPTVRITTRPDLQSRQNFLDDEDDDENEEEASDEDLDEEEERLDEEDEEDKGDVVVEDLEEVEDED